VGTQQYSACVVLVAVLVAGCGGGADTQTQSTCSLTNPAGCGGNRPPDPPPGPGPGPATPPPDPATQVAAVSLVLSSNELPSAGLPGTEVGVTALVKTAENTAVAGATVEFSADSGFLAVAATSTDKSGKASATLGTGGSRLNRPIKVTVKVGGKSASAVVNVVGTRLSLAGPASMMLGSSADRPIGGAELTASAANGKLVLAGATASDSQGVVPLRVTASQRGSEQINVSALGASASRTIMVGASDVILTPAVTLDAGGAELLAEVAVGACAPVDGRYAGAGAGQGGAVTLTASRGALYRDAACSQPLLAALTVVNGIFPRAYIKSDNAGVAALEASIAGGPGGGTRLEFVAPLLASAKVNLQTDLALVGNGERSTLIAVVRDGTAANNLVKGATVQFSIVADPSGGALLSPFTAVTGSDGVARAVFVGGPADGGKDGTVLQARVAGVPAASARTALTVNKKALSIQFGTGNTLVEFSSAVLQQDFAVFVSDSAGNPVKDVTISGAAWPTHYRKGNLKWDPQSPIGVIPGIYKVDMNNATLCANEDVQRKGLYDAAFDLNRNGVLDPGIPLSVSASGKTDALGLATISLRYPRDRANWVRVELTVTGTVAGTEALARSAFWLAGVAADYTEYYVSPPGRESVYGSARDCGQKD
jgi:hypothetical protein